MCPEQSKAKQDSPMDFTPSGCAYQPLTATENLARLDPACNGAFGNFSAGMRQFPYDCGYPVFLPRSPGPGFAGTLFEDTPMWVKSHIQPAYTASLGETRSGYPRTSYVPLSQAMKLPPQFALCNQ